MQRSDRDRKKQWKAAQRASAQAAFPLPDSDLLDFFDSIDAQVSAKGCDHSHRLTEAWLQSWRPTEVAKVLEWLRDNGGFCDCEVLLNARDHWEQNRVAAENQ